MGIHQGVWGGMVMAIRRPVRTAVRSPMVSGFFMNLR